MKFKKQFGNNKNNLFIPATDFTGKNKVLIITPMHPTKNQKNDTVDFILNELDDHSALNEYKKKFRK